MNEQKGKVTTEHAVEVNASGILRCCPVNIVENCLQISITFRGILEVL